MRTVYNQYDSLVRPLQKWLDEQGVSFALNTRVTDLGFARGRYGQAGRADHSSTGRPDRRNRGRRGRLCGRDPRLDDRGSSLGTNDHGAGAQGQARRRRLDALGDDRRRTGRNSATHRSSPTTSTSRNGSRSPRRSRSGLLQYRPRLHRQCAGRGRPDHLRRFALADVDRPAAPATFPRPAEGRERHSGATASTSTSPATSSQTDDRLLGPRD